MKPSIFAIALLCCASSPMAQDRPDPDFIDSDSDGIDGEIAAAVFVATTGSDFAPGTQAQPMLTIAAAIARAGTLGKSQVYVSRGTYVARVAMVSGIDLYGGFDAADGWSRAADHTTTIRSVFVSSSRVAAVEAHGLGVDTRIEAFRIETGTTSSQGFSNYAVLVNNPGAGRLRLRYLTIAAGGAGPSAAASPGTTPASAANGFGGNEGSCSSDVLATGGPGGTTTCGLAGGRGGNGGAPSASGNPGSPGAGGATPGTGGSAGSPAANGSSGAAGAAGAAGADGAAGMPGPVGGTYGFPYLPRVAGNGGGGTSGDGGGGGGGGGGEDCGFCIEGTGNGGGGGGAGGCPGSGGGGGTGGAGSFGVYAPNGGVTIDAVRISTGAGGNGGAGGTGGPGAGGGIGAFGAQTCTSEVGAGGRGGDGGVGGRGGHGGGGAGGPSIGIVLPSAASVGAGVRVTPGSSGAPGASLGNLGAPGLVAVSAPASIALAGTPTLTIEPMTGFEHGAPLRFPVVLANVIDATVQVSYTTVAGTADAADFTPVSGTLVFDPWTSLRTIEVPFLDDTTDEPEETFTVVLSAPDGATISVGSAEGRIVDNDVAVLLDDGFESPPP